MSLDIVGDNTQAEVTFHPGYVLTPCVCARWSVLGPGNALRSVATTWPGPGSRALLIFSQCQDIGETGVQSVGGSTGKWDARCQVWIIVKIILLHLSLCHC